VVAHIKQNYADEWGLWRSDPDENGPAYYLRGKPSWQKVLDAIEEVKLEIEQEKELLEQEKELEEQEKSEDELREEKLNQKNNS
jgi:hypothetical protein